MTIQRVPEAPFAQIANAALRDGRLSFRARGILAMVLSHTGEWEAGLDWLSKQGTEGRDALQTALLELNRYGYRVVQKSQKPDGTWYTWVEWKHDPTGPRETSAPVSATGPLENRVPVSQGVSQNTIKEHFVSAADKEHTHRDEEKETGVEEPRSTSSRRAQTDRPERLTEKWHPALFGYGPEDFSVDYPGVSFNRTLKMFIAKQISDGATSRNWMQKFFTWSEIALERHRKDGGDQVETDAMGLPLDRQRRRRMDGAVDTLPLIRQRQALMAQIEQKEETL